MGLHLDIDAISQKNKLNLTGKRKMGFLVNEDDKLTKELRLQKQAFNEEKYGLKLEKIEETKKLLPPPSEVSIFHLEKIIHGKKIMSTIEKIVHLGNLEEALLKKIEKKKLEEQKSKDKEKLG